MEVNASCRRDHHHGFGLAQGQTFDVASIRASPPNNYNFRRSGGPGTKDPELFSCENEDLFSLIAAAFNIPEYRLSGPEWTRDARFNISATIPAGTTKEQFQRMQQSLLIERFRITLHHENKEMQGYDLVVAKSGPKFKETEPAAAPKDPDAPPPPGPWRNDQEGFPIIPPDDNRRMLFGLNGNHAVQRFPGRTMELFAAYLINSLAQPINDATDLRGTYDFSLKWIIHGSLKKDDDGPDIFQAVQAQLGLKLESTKLPVDVLVIDHIDKTPSDN